ncbi:MAG: hypothetical protein LBV21_06895 [Candidatus Adiutrix sp.]|nr:hypothetical protein [Candidatus Adiutrix sp.]
MASADPSKEILVPSAPADLEWVWVLAAPRTKVSDSLLVVDFEDRDRGRRRVLPVFETRENAAGLKGRLCRERPEDYGEQAMLLSEAGRFAAGHQLEIMLLDAAGTIVAHLEATLNRIH